MRAVDIAVQHGEVVAVPVHQAVSGRAGYLHVADRPAVGIVQEDAGAGDVADPQPFDNAMVPAGDRDADVAALDDGPVAGAVGPEETWRTRPARGRRNAFAAKALSAPAQHTVPGLQERRLHALTPPPGFCLHFARVPIRPRLTIDI